MSIEYFSIKYHRWFPFVQRNVFNQLLMSNLIDWEKEAFWKVNFSLHLIYVYLKMKFSHRVHRQQLNRNRKLCTIWSYCWTSSIYFLSKKPITLTKHVLHDDNHQSIATLRRSQRQISKQSGITKYKSATSFDSYIETQCEDGLEARQTGTVRGRGVYTTKKFFRNDYIVEYAGELLTQAQARQRENQYGRNHNIGCYMYYFKWGEKVFCVDATEETNRLGEYEQ